MVRFCSVARRSLEIMLTPSFDIEQNDQFVILTIRVPYIKISEAEFHIKGTEFKFYCKPYFLRLHLPGELADDDRQKASYDVDKGTIVVQLPKLHPGQHFENLGMITSLLSKKPTKDLRKVGVSPGIEVVPGNSGSDAGAEVEGNGGEGSGEESDDEFDWQVEQQLPMDQSSGDEVCGLSLEATARNSYGFANQHSDVFSKLQEEIPSIVDCPDPDHMTSYERRVARITHEEASFDPQHYLADLMDNDTIETLVKYEPPWSSELVKWREKQKALLSSVTSAAAPLPVVEPGQDIVSFTSEERDQLKELPNRDFLLDKATRRSLYLGLVDTIFAYAYNHRTTLGENNVESAWNICKISSTLSWLEVFQGSVYEVIYCCVRRSLTYPLFRHWQLALSVLQDTRDIFCLVQSLVCNILRNFINALRDSKLHSLLLRLVGRRKVLQCLLAVRQLLNSSEPYYILNNLYITDYCVWIQKASAKKIQSIADELDEVKLNKKDVGWDLVELEQAAHLVLEEESQIKQEDETPTDVPLEELTSTFEKINLSPGPVAAADSATERTNSFTETEPTLLQSVQEAEDKRKYSNLPTTELCCSASPIASSSGKPLIEEIAVKPDGTTSSSSCSSSESEPTVSSSDEDSPSSTGSSGTAKSDSAGET